MSQDIQVFNDKQEDSRRVICELLAKEIQSVLMDCESKIWHGAPVWFMDGNPLVGYDVLKGCVRLLFWSGQSFEEDGLKPEGSFKAAEARYTEVSQIDISNLHRWLKKSEQIQWDYKNIVKRRGVLKRLR